MSAHASNSDLSAAVEAEIAATLNPGLFVQLDSLLKEMSSPPFVSLIYNNAASLKKQKDAIFLLEKLMTQRLAHPDVISGFLNSASLAKSLTPFS